MFNPDLKELLKDNKNRYSLVVGIAKRACQIRTEAIENDNKVDDKDVSLAVDDILSGKYVVEEPEELNND